MSWAERLAPTVEHIAELIAASQLQHADETGIRVYGMLHWLHVNCTRFLTHLSWHASRGRQPWMRSASGRALQADQPPPSPPSAGMRTGRPKQSKAKNLLDALLARADQVLALLDDLRIPFTNHQAERDLRWAKVQQKIAGTFRNVTGVTAFCRIRSYLSTMQKQGHSMLAALTAVFHGQPLPVAWAPGEFLRNLESRETLSTV
jgi:hypothetical protein